MYPTLSLPFLDIPLHTFGLFLVISIVCFTYMLQKMCKKASINPNFFLGSALAFVLSTFLVSRLTFIMLEWRDYQYIVQDSFFNFFVMSDYNMSLFGGIIGFLGVFIYKLLKHSQKPGKYVDALVTAFLFAAIPGFMGAFLGGQIYGVPTSLPIGILYSETTKIPYTSAIIPLGIFYATGSFLIFSCIYISKEFLKISGAVGYLGIALFALMILIGEFFSGSDDMMRDLISLNFSQIGALVGLGCTGIWLFREIRSIK